MGSIVLNLQRQLIFHTTKSMNSSFDKIVMVKFRFLFVYQTLSIHHSFLKRLPDGYVSGKYIKVLLFSVLSTNFIVFYHKIYNIDFVIEYQETNVCEGFCSLPFCLFCYSISIVIKTEERANLKMY